MFFNVRRIDEKTIFASVSNLFMHSTIYATLGEVDNILSYTSMSIMVIEMILINLNVENDITPSTSDKFLYFKLVYKI